MYRYTELVNASSWVLKAHVGTQAHLHPNPWFLMASIELRHPPPGADCLCDSCVTYHRPPSSCFSFPLPFIAFFFFFVYILYIICKLRVTVTPPYLWHSSIYFRHQALWNPNHRFYDIWTSRERKAISDCSARETALCGDGTTTFTYARRGGAKAPSDENGAKGNWRRRRERREEKDWR